jgi:hypothetical protein
MHARITAITELAVESGLTNRLPPDNAKQSFFLALSPLPKRRQFGFPRARKRESLHHVIGCSASRSRLHDLACLTTLDQMAAHRKSDRHAMIFARADFINVHWRAWAANRPHDKNFASLNAIRLFALAAASTANGLIDWLRATAFVDGGR